jgi:hypothetical protein
VTTASRTGLRSVAGLALPVVTEWEMIKNGCAARDLNPEPAD